MNEAYVSSIAIPAMSSEHLRVIYKVHKKGDLKFKWALKTLMINNSLESVIQQIVLQMQNYPVQYNKRVD